MNNQNQIEPSYYINFNIHKLLIPFLDNYCGTKGKLNLSSAVNRDCYFEYYINKKLITVSILNSYCVNIFITNKTSIIAIIYNKWLRYIDITTVQRIYNIDELKEILDYYLCDPLIKSAE